VRPEARTRWRSSAPAPAWQPPIDVYETERALTIIAALPGVEPATLAVRLAGGGLEISGRRPLPECAARADVHRLEIPHGEFRRAVALPPGRYEVEEKRSEHGCLVLVLKKLP
jgi:HSP20 family molecular chaperone IbpA